MSYQDAFRGKRVLVTGHTGFKGAWLSLWLESLGAEVIGISLDPEGDRGVFARSGIGKRMSDHRVDIRDKDKLVSVIKEERPEVVFHLAAQALVLESYRTPVDTFHVNTLGTAHVLEAIRHTPSVRAAVIVTTDKCYENLEVHRGYRETDAMGGHDPYSASKGAAEIVIASYRRAFFSEKGAAAITSARSGNVIGGGDWSADRLVPDLIRAVEAGVPLKVRHPGSIRPWQHVLEPVHGYLLLAARSLVDPELYAGAWNFGPRPSDARTVGELVDAALKQLGKGEWARDGKEDHPHEAGILMLDIDKAMTQLDWKPRLSFDDTVRLTIDWYMNYTGEGTLELCRQQINEFSSRGDHQA